MGQAPTSLARSYPYEYGCDSRLMRLSSGIRSQDDEVAMAAHLRDYADFLEVTAERILPCGERLKTSFH